MRYLKYFLDLFSLPLLLLVLLFTASIISYTLLLSISSLNIGQGTYTSKNTLIEDKYDPLALDSLLTKDEIRLMSVLDSMSVEEKVGQLFIGGSSKVDLMVEQLVLLEHKYFGGVILFKVNVSDVSKRTQTIEMIAKSRNNSKIKPFIAIDEEGGEVTRLYSQLSQQIPQYQITDQNMAYDTAFTRGSELAGMGINMNLSPVMDLTIDSDSALYKRTFRGDREIISILSESMLLGYKKAGIIAVPKHFPGHPDNNVDSHNTLPVVDLDRAEFDQFAAQFKSMIERNPPEALMTAHVKFPAIDPDSPTTLSRTILTDILRSDYKYEGLIISDDMNMGAIKNNMPFEEGCIRAIEAGVDILIIVTDPKYQESAYNAVLNAVNTGRISEERIDESVIRILRVKDGL